MQRSGIQVGKIELGILMTNFYYLYREEGRGEGGKPQKTPVICIDPADHGEEIYETLIGQSLVPEVILLTHAHFDHIRGVQALQRLSGAPVYCYKEEKELCEDPDKNGSAAYGHPITVQPSAYLSDGEEILAAGLRCILLATPGHTKGSCSYYVPEGGFVLSGDTLFDHSVGRTDMATGSQEELLRSIREKLFVLPDETIVYPGHESETTIGEEKAHNPFLIENTDIGSL
ncbi:MAG: MBL fold metallo-hydrolase [Lachnospiraceae bacterium]|nr:MBL fold metallo-hydrolase [Lachnospiraceae bacterium]